MTNRKGWIIIVNPKAYNRRGLRHWPKLSNLLHSEGVDFSCVFSEHRSHAVELVVKAVENGYRKIAVFGGLGTFHNAVNGACLQKHADTDELLMAYIPVIRLSRATQTDYIDSNRGLHDGFSTYSQAAKALAAEKFMETPVFNIRYTETMVKHDVCMIRRCGLGFDAACKKRKMKRQDKGQTGNILNIIDKGLIYTFFKTKGHRISVDGKEVFNSRLFSAKIEPLALGLSCSCQTVAGNPMPGNAVLRISIIPKFRITRTFRYMRRIRNGTLYSDSRTIRFTGNTIEIGPSGKGRNRNIMIQTDKETLGYAPISISYSGRNLRILKADVHE